MPSVPSAVVVLFLRGGAPSNPWSCIGGGDFADLECALQPQEVTDLKQFLLICKRSDAKGSSRPPALDAARPDLILRTAVRVKKTTSRKTGASGIPATKTKFKVRSRLQTRRKTWRSHLCAPGPLLQVPLHDLDRQRRDRREAPRFPSPLFVVPSRTLPLSR